MTDRPNKAEVGKIGEDTASRWLKSKGFKIIERNYWKKWGEIDIVTQKDNVLHFVEVKAVVRRIEPFDLTQGNYAPEDNVHSWKLKRLSRAIQTYLLDREIDDEQEWQIDVLTVELDFDTRRARINLLPDVG